MSPIRWVARCAPLAFLATAGCFATRTDVRIVNSEVARLRGELALRDSARRVQDDRLAASLRAVMEETRDSLRAVTAQLGRHNADSREELYAIAQQLIQIQAMQGLSQQRLQEMRADLEARSREPVVTVPPPGVVTGRDTTVATALPPDAGVPGPNQLYQLALDQLRAGSYGTARSGFGALLRQYPASELAADAQYHIGLAFASEGQDALADSAFALVVSRYPTSPRAPTALYKRGVALAAAGQTRLARTVLTQLIDKYPMAAEVELARDRLRTLPPAP